MIAPTVSKSATPARVLQVARARYHAPRERVAIYVSRAARRFGIQPSTLHKQLHGDRPISELLAAVIDEAVRDGQRDRAEAFFAPLEVAIRQVTGRLTRELIVRAFIADNDENEAALAFLLNDSGATRRQWKRHIEMERSAKLEIWHALAR